MTNHETDRQRARDLRSDSWSLFGMALLCAVGAILYPATKSPYPVLKHIVTAAFAIGSLLYLAAGILKRRRARMILGMQFSGVQPVDPIPPPPSPRPRPEDR